MENREAGALKAEWRARMAKIRDRLSAAEREALSGKLCAVTESEGLSRLRRELGRPLTLCAYAPYRSEASPMPLVAACLDRGDTVVATRMRTDGDGLELRRIGALSDWMAGRWGVPEPDPRRTALLAETSPLDVVLVPGLAYNKAGGRLGYGGGFYDRLYMERRRLAPEARTLWLGFAFSGQVVAEVLPAEEHDLKLDGLATDEGVLWFAEDGSAAAWKRGIRDGADE
ncbi:5-formyltetrahydrofolate cyclo-ligase [Cohnella hongkongensis]|uniref:5-formyltetrahydrofolate cyclo-ligase n=1 Tax=Cohnella hongkongensis TaxID=178337 RepID=A0ABV9FB51_9BACL